MSEKIYTWLLRLFPSRFRNTYGEDALQLFRDRVRHRERLPNDAEAVLARSICHISAPPGLALTESREPAPKWSRASRERI